MHLSVCAAKEGITYSLDNFKYQGDVWFSVYFDFDFVFFDSKIYVVTYSQIYTFNPALNLDQTVT